MLCGLLGFHGGFGAEWSLEYLKTLEFGVMTSVGVGETEFGGSMHFVQTR